MPNPTQENESPEQATTDEALGAELDRRLELLRSGNLSHDQASSPGGLEFVVDQLHELAVMLSTSVARGSTVNAIASETGEYTPGAPSAESAVVPARRDEKIGKYEVRRVLGQGGQGSALLALDPDLRRHVVLKLYHGAMGSEGQVMLLSEGRALARVRSPYVAQCFAVEPLDGASYLVVEYIPGQSLTEVLLKGRPERDWALRVTRQLAEGLSVIHACGLLHRDIKPSNIIIGDDGLPRLVDFGLAAHLASDQLRRVSGTLAYMAPEQARGELERIDARTDLFGLGAVLYEMLTGAPPRQGLSRKALMELAQRGDIIPASQKSPDLPPELSALCARCLAKEPAQRYDSAQELMRAIDECVPQKTSWLARLEARFGKLPVRVGLAAGVLLVISAPIALWAAFHGNEQPASPPVGLNPGLVQGEGPKQPLPPPKKTGPADDRPLKKDFEVTLKLLDHPEATSIPWQLVDGERIAFSVEVARDAYVGVWYIDHEGNKLQLFPNEEDKDHLVLAGQVRRIPGEKERSMLVTPQLGPEHVRVLASTRRWSPLAGERAGPDGIYAAFTSPAKRLEWEDRVRGLVLEADSFISELVIPLEVKPKKP